MASRTGRSNQGQDLRVEDLGLDLWKDFRNRRCYLRESGVPFCCSGSENAGLEEHRAAEVPVAGDLKGDLTPGTGLGLPT